MKSQIQSQEVKAKKSLPVEEEVLEPTPRVWSGVAEPTASSTPPETLQQVMPCRCCGGEGLQRVLSLGLTPLANDLLKKPRDLDSQERYPLELAFCPDCTLVQITETVPPETLFKDYLYFSSFSDTMLAHAEVIAKRVIVEHKLDKDSLAVELASNDGYLLKNYVSEGIPVLGIEPADNVAEVAEKAGVQTLVEFFDDSIAQALASQDCKADVIHANNVLAHVADTNSFVRGMWRLLKDDGVAIVEVPYLWELLKGCEFDTIYHEHLCYFSLTALDNLFARNGLTVFDVERLKIHGGSLRIYAQRTGSIEAKESVKDLLQQEKTWGVADSSRYGDFAQQVKELKRDLLGLLNELKSKGYTIAAYGAAAKGSTLLNYVGIGPDLVDFVVDRSPHKQGKYMPGVAIPIHPPEYLAEQMPDYTLLLTWNFAEEIMKQQSEYRAKGGQFIVPVPRPRIVGIEQAHEELQR